MKEDFFINVLKHLAKESKCVSKQVGCLLVKEDRIISSGYNGTISGSPNCNTIFDTNSFDREIHHKWSLLNEIHAEQNAIAISAKLGICLNNSICYTSMQPCNTCILLLAQSGVKQIIYVEPYDKSDYHQDMLTSFRNIGLSIKCYSK